MYETRSSAKFRVGRVQDKLRVINRWGEHRALIDGKLVPLPNDVGDEDEKALCLEEQPTAHRESVPDERASEAPVATLGPSPPLTLARPPLAALMKAGLDSSDDRDLIMNTIAVDPYALATASDDVRFLFY